MKRSSLALTLFAAYAIACGGSARHTAGIVDSGDADLTDCTYLRKVNGSASDFDPDAASVSKRKAKAEAAAIGATHVKWIVPCCTYVEAEAYRCDTPEFAQASLD